MKHVRILRTASSFSLCDEITLANENIAKVLSELEELRAGLGSKCGGNDIEVEFTEVTIDKDEDKTVSEEDFA